MLDNFIDLVVAVLIATKRSTSAQQQSSYTSRMEAYLNGVLKLFPDISIVPNHHLALHLVDFLALWGPPHGWWSFPFERYNGILKSFPTNFRFGEHWPAQRESAVSYITDET